MKFPQTSDEIKSEILICSDKFTEVGDLRIRQLIKILRKVDPEIVVEAVLMVFENVTRPDKSFQDQEFAGKILQQLNPTSKKDLKEVLTRTLKNWNKSVEQFPFWMKINYGIEILHDTIDKLDLSEIEKDKLAAIKWWLQGNQSSA